MLFIKREEFNCAWITKVSYPQHCCGKRTSEHGGSYCDEHAMITHHVWPPQGAKRARPEEEAA